MIGVMVGSPRRRRSRRRASLLPRLDALLRRLYGISTEGATQRPDPAEQAAAWGLIWECVDDARLLPAARALAARLVALPARGLAMTKQLLNASTANSLHEQLEREREVMRVLGHGEDYREGVRAFLEKRKPVFTGK